MTQPIHYSIEVIQDEARYLVDKGLVSRWQPLYVLCEYISGREWSSIELELEENNFLLRDPIGDLIGCEKWDND